MARKRRLGAIEREDIMTAAGQMKHACLKRFKTKQYVSACSRIVDKMTKELLKRGPELTPRDVAAAANASDAKCSKYKTKQYGSVCSRVVGGFIRTIAKAKPGLQGRRRR